MVEQRTHNPLVAGSNPAGPTILAIKEIGYIMLTENATLEEVQKFFAADRFSTEACGVYIIEAAKGYSLCAFDVTPTHFNAAGDIMGGAIFTLADFALGVGSNIGENPSVSISNTIEFLAASKGKKLFAECRVDKSGRSVGFYTVTVTDNLNTTIAIMTATCYRATQ